MAVGRGQHLSTRQLRHPVQPPAHASYHWPAHALTHASYHWPAHAPTHANPPRAHWVALWRSSWPVSHYGVTPPEGPALGDEELAQLKDLHMIVGSASRLSPSATEVRYWRRLCMLVMPCNPAHLFKNSVAFASRLLRFTSETAPQPS